MRIAFFGSSDFSVPTLKKLAESGSHELVGVVAQPDRPKGRNRKIQPGVVHQAARDLSVPVILPASVGCEESMPVLEGWNPDLILVASYGQFIPSKVRKLPSKGIINVHPSLLPKYRGAAPLQWSIAKGEKISGVTIFHIVKEMDAGDIIVQEEYPIEPDETAVELSERFALIGAELAIRAADLIESGNAAAVPQNEGEATYAPKIDKTDGAINWELSAQQIHNRVRGFQPWPGNYFTIEGHTVKVWRTRLEEGQGKPGEVLDASGDGPLVMTGKGAIRLLQLQPEGKKSMPGDAFLCGHRWDQGMIIPGFRELEGT